MGVNPQSANEFTFARRDLPAKPEAIPDRLELLDQKGIARI
jgi:hypothetical protein